MNKSSALVPRASGSRKVTLFHGDCIRLLERMPAKSVSLIVTSPPYNLGKEYEPKRSLQDYLLLQRIVIANCVRILRPGGSICWEVGNHVNGHGQIIPLDMRLHEIFSGYESTDEVRLRNRIIWHFEHGLHCQNRFSGRHETILWYTKGDKYTFHLDAVRTPQKYPGKKAYKGKKKGQFSGNPLGKNPGDVWIFPNVKGNHIEKTVHPCQFPVELPERLVLALTNKGDLVVDPFMGVGSTGVAAVLHGRQFAGADLSKKYVQIARKRIDLAAHKKLKYRNFRKPVYVPKPNTPLTTPPKHFKLPK
jgi:adenine-specific DNA-methyltransferase